AQLTANNDLESRMNSHFLAFNGVHPAGDSATHPIEPLTTRPGSLLALQAAASRRSFSSTRRAYPDTPPAAHSQGEFVFR
ncbi:MAG: hypothetical protein WCI85_16320, partial [Comamonadaceae bacterium]